MNRHPSISFPDKSGSNCNPGGSCGITIGAGIQRVSSPGATALVLMWTAAAMTLAVTPTVTPTMPRLSTTLHCGYATSPLMLLTTMMTPMVLAATQCIVHARIAYAGRIGRCD